MVVRIADRDVVSVAGEGGAKRTAGPIDHGPIGSSIDAVLAIGPANGATCRYLALLAHAEAKSRVAWIRLQVADQVVALRSYIGDAGNRAGSELPLDGQVP